MHKTEDWNTDWTYKRAPWDEVNPGKILEGEKVTLPHKGMESIRRFLMGIFRNMSVSLCVFTALIKSAESI